MGALLGVLAPFVGPLIEWMHKRGLIKDERARNSLAWWTSQADRHEWPAERKRRLDDALARARARSPEEKEEG